MGPPALALHGITKRFGALLANDDISLTLQPGEVLALLGENGAGKSTLVSILFGHYTADAGRIEVDGRPLKPGDTRAALEAGIGMVHQHFSLADNLSVLDNVMLGTESLWRPWSRRTDARARLLQAAGRFGLDVDPDAMIGALSVGQRQRVEILKALVRGARVLILDEPTSVLTPAESEMLFATVDRMVAQGMSAIFISHKLDEVMRVSHRVAVLRGGRLVSVVATGGTDKDKLASLMVGRDVRRPGRVARVPGACVLELRDATVRSEHERGRLDGVDLALRAGEIVAIAGVSGNGQQVLAEVLFGLRALDHGSVSIGGGSVRARPRYWVNAGVARVPEDRHAVGVIGDFPVWENAILERYATATFSRRGVMKRAAARDHAGRVVSRFDVRGTQSMGAETPTRGLSGGNMQKLILGRALMGDPAVNRVPLVIIAEQPTWGLDIGAVAYVHEQLFDARNHGSAILLILDDLEEIFAVADRIAVMCEGRLTEARTAADWTMDEIGLAMAGGGTRAPDGTAARAH